MAWTNEQKRAIETRNKNLLVSAAAGSGKTAVMVERINSMVTREEVPIENFLVVTFTAAAANEMKSKIRKSISASLKNGEGDRNFLKRQLNGLNDAYISTFHKFCMRVIRKFFYIIKVEPSMKVCDENMQEILKERALDRLIEEEFIGEKQSDFIKFLDAYSSDRNFNRIKNMLKANHEAIMSRPYPFQFLEEKLNWLKELDGGGFIKSDIFAEILNGIEDALQNASRYLKYALKKMAEEGLRGYEKSSSGVNGFGAELQKKSKNESIPISIIKEEYEIIYSAIEDILEIQGIIGQGSIDAVQIERVEKGFREIKGKLNELRPEKRSKSGNIRRERRRMQVPKKDDDFETWNYIKREISKYRDEAFKIIFGTSSNEFSGILSTFFAITLEESVEIVRRTVPYAETFVRLEKLYDDIYSELKQEKNLMDFADIEHMTIAILNNNEAQEYYRGLFKQICIDEYQDTNYTQEEIIKKISKEDNVFMVGDIKQCIYRFRNAEPEIFYDKRKRYRGSDRSKNESIELNKNFRSKRGILNFINETFVNIMPGYDDDAKLYFGYEDVSSQVEEEPELIALEEGKKGRRDFNEQQIDSPKNLIEGSFEYAKEEMSGAEKEARYIASRIRKILDEEKYIPIKANSDEEERKFHPSDIAILLRSLKDISTIYEKALAEEGIESIVQGEESYFELKEIALFMNLLTIIDNSRKDVELISVLHSFMYGFSAEDLAKIRIEKRDVAFIEAVEHYGEFGTDMDLKGKCEGFLDDLNAYRETARVMNLPDFIWDLMLRTNYYTMVSTTEEGNSNAQNLRELVSMSERFSDESPSSLYSFIKYVQALKKKKKGPATEKPIGDLKKCVRIMTIHKSKGLEFPIVFVGGMSKRLSYTKLSNEIRVSDFSGISMPLVNRNEGWIRKTILQLAEGISIRKEEEAENVRILYVAMTRAIDRLIMVGRVSSIEEDREKTDIGIRDTNSFFGMLRGIRNKTYIPEDELDEYIQEGLSQGDSKNMSNEDDKPSTGKDLNSFDAYSRYYDGNETEKAYREAAEKIRYNMEFKPDIRNKEKLIKPKYSVTELTGQSEEIRVKEPEFISDDSLKSADVGTAYHSILYHLPFYKCYELIKGEGEKRAGELIRDVIRKLISKNIIKESEASKVKVENILRLLTSELGERMAVADKSGLLEREKEFTYKGFVHIDSVGKREVMIQGIVDAYFYDAEDIVLIDYKSNYVNSKLPWSEEENRLRETYRKQIEIYRKAVEEGSGKKVKEAYLFALDAGKKILM